MPVVVVKPALYGYSDIRGRRDGRERDRDRGVKDTGERETQVLVYKQVRTKMIVAQIPMCFEDEQERKRTKTVQKRGRKRSVKCLM